MVKHLADTRSSRRAFNHKPKKPGFLELNRNELINRGAKVWLAPTTDYLVLGTCLEPDHYDILTEWLPGHTFTLSKRFFLSRGVIYFDSNPVGRVSGSRAGTTRYGKKMTFHFTGKFFRKPGTRPGEETGSGMSESAALDFVELFAKYLVREEVLPAGWMKFRTIDRWDVCQELEFDKEVTPDNFRQWLTLPLGMFWGEYRESKTGQTVYGSTSSKPLANRGDFPLLAMYQKAENPNRMRFEVRIPKVRNVDPDASFGQHNAAEYIAQLLNALSPIPVQMEHRWAERDPLTRRHPQDGNLLVTPLTFNPGTPEEYQRLPYGGHPTKTLRRMMRQGLTVISRATTAFVTASLLSGCEYGPDEQPGEVFQELVEQAQAGPGVVRPPVDDAPLSYDLIGAPLPGSEARPFDGGYPIEALRNAVPINLDELQEVQMALEIYRARCLPDTQPFWETHRSEIASLQLPPDIRLMNVDYEHEILRNVYDSDQWMARYLEPTAHEPLNLACDANRGQGWLACATEREIAFWSPKSRKAGEPEPDISVSRS